MIIESVRTILGTDLTKQVEDALKGKGKDGADLDLVVGNDGSVIPAETHEMVKGQLATAEGTIKTVASTLKDLGGTGDTENLAADVLKAKVDFEAAQTANTAKMAEIQKTTALKLGLGSTVHDPEDIIGRLNLDEIELDDKGALKTNIDDLVKDIKESKPYLFKEAPKTELELKGAVPGQVGGTGSAGADDVNAQALDAAFELGGE